MTPAEVCDAVFGVETRDTPSLRWMPGQTCVPWATCFDGPMPGWWVEPRYWGWSPADYHPWVHVVGRFVTPDGQTVTGVA